MKLHFYKLVFVVWWSSLYVLTLSLTGKTDPNAFLSVLDDHENSKFLLKDVIGTSKTYILERDMVYLHNHSASFNLDQSRTNIVTFVWMSQAQSNSLGNNFTRHLRILQDAFTNMYVQNLGMSENTAFVFGGFIDPGELKCPKIHLGLTEPTSVNATGLFYRGVFTWLDRNGTPLIIVAIVFDSVGQQLRIESSNFTGFDCEESSSLFQLTSFVMLHSPKMSDVSSVESYVCSVVHSTFNKCKCKSTHLTVDHYPFFFTRRGENSYVNAEINSTAHITTYFDLSTATDLSHFVDRHKRAVSDVQVYCTKIDRYGYVNNSIIDNLSNSDRIRKTSKFERMPNWIRLKIHLEIDIADESDFGDYGCEVRCVIVSHAELTESYGCEQVNYFSIMPQNWRGKQIVQEYRADRYHDSFTDALEQVEKLQDENVALKVTGELVFILLLIIVYAYIIMPYWKERTRKQEVGVVGSVLKAVHDGTTNRTWKYDVFLSYSSRDREWVSNLYDFLSKNKYNVCYDEVCFPYGCCIPKEIAAAVSCSRRVIAIVSPNFVSSGWTEFEYVLRITQIMEEKGSWESLLPVLYKPCTIPFALKPFKYIDYASMRENVSRQSLLSRLFASFGCSNNCSSTAEEEIYENFTNILIQRLGKPLSQASLNKKYVKVKRARRKKHN